MHHMNLINCRVWKPIHSFQFRIPQFKMKLSTLQPPLSSNLLFQEIHNFAIFNKYYGELIYLNVMSL